MPEVSACPDRQSLAHLLDLRTKEEDAAPLEEHLLACDRCCDALREMEAADTLVDAARGTTAKLPADEEVQQAIERLKVVAVPPPGFEETLASKCEATDDAWGLENLLDPPEGEGELGRFGGYRVLRVLGAGGMGLVFEAEDPKLRRSVALKVMKRSLASRDEHHQRFLREARAAAAIEHQHIVTVYQVGEHKGLPFMAMQLLKGEALDDRLRREPRLPMAECLRIGRETAEALSEAHQRKLIHRDIKPGNIWLEGARGWVKLLDFGLAHAAEDVHLTQTGAILGTPAYMSPEQARGEAVDGRTDLYSLGAVLYKLTTGDVPFRGANTMAVLMALATETPRRPSQIDPDIPPALDDLIVRLLAKKPDERYESAAAVAEAIRAIEHESPKSEVQSPKLEKDEGRRRARWPFIVAAAAAAFVLVTIVVIVRDKDGKELARMSVDGGASAEVRTDAAASKVDPVLRDGSVSPSANGQPTSSPRSDGATAAAADISRPVQVPGPPPLEEWLEGRTVLTVAQDGSGQFKTIQAALDALRPGQVVEVLDRGPYHEVLSIIPPKDTGLISDAFTEIQASVAKDGPLGDEPGDFHSFDAAEGFRLSGFIFRRIEGGRYGDYHRTVNMSRSGGVVVENCVFEQAAAAKDKNIWGMFMNWDERGRPPDANFVRNSIFTSRLMVSVPVVTVEQNWFLTDQNRPFVFSGRERSQVVFRHNVLDGAIEDGVFSYDNEGTERFEVSNNTIVNGGLLVHKIRWNATLGTTVRNNLFGGPMLFTSSATQLLPDAMKEWSVGHNSYPHRPAGQNVFQKQASDSTGAVDYLSIDSANRDYLRLRPDSVPASAGAGGDWPTYIGALPPGPAPKEGDWFTRLQERWMNVAPALREGSAGPLPEVQQPSPPRSVGATLPEPPPLEEWLKGREALTVAQDGSGQFLTIQEALNALKPHQVVKVLDRGPYRESIRTAGLPDDTGLISDQQATVETLAWPDDGMGHAIGPVEKFRLAGIRFVAPTRDSWGTIVFCGEPSGLVVEDCCFALTAALDPSRSVAGLGFALENDVSDDSPIVVRDCLFDYAILSITGAVGHSTFVVERNYFRNSNVGLGNRLDRAIVRHNVFDGAKACFWIQGLSDVGRVLEICNNTAATGVTVVNGAPLRVVVLRNNITGHDVEVDEQVYKLRAEMAKNWQRDHNSYLRRPLFAKSPTDVTVEPAYLSSEPADRNYLRIPAGGPQAVGGAGGELPSYIGALPPGPAPKEGDWFTRLRERWQTDLASDASLPRETINVLAMLDLSKDLVSIANLTGDNKWSKSEGTLTYHSDGRSGKIVAPVDLKAAKDYEIVVDVRRLLGDSVFTLDFPSSEKLGTGLDVYIGGRIELKLENGQRHKIGEWPAGLNKGGTLVARVRHETANRPGSVDVSVNGTPVVHWEGLVANIGNPLESHPAFPGRMTLGLFCFKDSFEFRSWQLRVFEGYAEPLRPVAGQKD